MKALMIVGAVAAVIALTGCGDGSGKGGATNAVSANPADAPADYLRAVVKGQQTAVKVIDTASITKAIQLFSAEEGRNPKDLSELVEQKYLPRIPDVPQGMKLVYDPNAGTVRVVAQ